MEKKKKDGKDQQKTARANRKPGESTRIRERILKRRIRLGMALCAILVFVGCGLLLTGRIILDKREELRVMRSTEELSGGGPEDWVKEGAPWIDVQLLSPNPYSRPQIALEGVRAIAIHYTANPGSSAQANRDYFENLAVTQETKVSSHFVVGLEGEVIQCIPSSEMSYATNARNVDTLSIETCHMDETGMFSPATYESLVKLTAWLCTRFGLTEEQVIRHYDVTGKECPKYFVDNPEAWTQFKADVGAQIREDYLLQEKGT